MANQDADIAAMANQDADIAAMANQDADIAAMANQDADIAAMASQDADTADRITIQLKSLGINLPAGIIKLHNNKVELSAQIRNLDKLKIHEYFLNEDNKVLFLGEGNFTFSAAVASFRGTWNNIIPSECSLEEGETDYNKLFRTMIVEMVAHEDTTDSEFRSFVQNLVRLKDEDWKPREVNAVNLNETWNKTKTCELEPKPNTLFFQCPWWHEVHTLVSEFFESAKDFQINDDLLFLSICKDPYYFGRYGLQSEYAGYKLLGADDVFCKDMFVRGYKHRTGYTPKGYWVTLTPDQLNSFVTLSYRRHEPTTETPSTQASEAN